MEQIKGIVQIGARGVGSARAGEVEVAKAISTTGWRHRMRTSSSPV